MIPSAYDEMPVLTEKKQGSKTYALGSDGHIRGSLDGGEALKQSIYCIVSTPKYVHAIYSHGYGFDGAGIIGVSLPLGYAQIQEEITNALMHDDRISAVEDFSFSRPRKGAVHVSFTVKSENGTNQSTEVTVDV